MNRKNGKIIVIEGLDGSGKATQIKLLSNELKKIKKHISTLSFPDYNSPSSSLAKMYLNSEFSKEPKGVNPWASSSFFAVDRCASFLKNWQEKYNKGELFLADRYTTSNAIYQMAKLEKENWQEFIDWMQDYEYQKLGLPKPDLVLFLDMPIEVSQNFMTLRYQGKEDLKDLHEKNIVFLKECRQAALFAAEKLDWKIIDCSKNGKPKTIDEIHKIILETVLNDIFIFKS